MAGITRNRGTGDQALLSNYLANVAKYGRIDRDEEKVLAFRIRTGDEEALSKMVITNLRLVLKIAYKYRNRYCSFLDLINEGNIGLIYAARKYNPDFGLRFSSYAVWWIKQSISLFLIQHAKGPISVPIRKVLLQQKVNKEAERLRSMLKRKATVEELALRLKLSPKVIKETLRIVPEYAGWEDHLEHSVEEDADIERHVDNRLCTKALEVLMEGLSDSERRGVELYYGLHGGAENNYAQIGRELSMSREGARQLIKRSLIKLRAMPRVDNLQAYL